MIRLQDIAEMAGVSRTTVSNVINGNTKRVSQKTIDKITTILKEQNYVPHMGSVMPVSYTHLDVYKRQEMWKRFTSMKAVFWKMQIREPI